MGEHHDGIRLEMIRMSVRYAILGEKTPRNYAAYATDLPGCVATGDTREAVVREMRSATALHIDREPSRKRGARADTALSGRDGGLNAVG